MRILITYGRRRPYPLFGVHLAQAFRRTGHQAWLACVRDRPWWGTIAKRLPEPWKTTWRWDLRARANVLLLQFVERVRPHVIVEIGGDLFLDETLRAVKRRGNARLVLWLVEGPNNLERTIGLFEYHLLVSTSRDAVRQLRGRGLCHTEYLPFATDPQWFRPRRNGSPQHVVGFIGAYAPRRAAYLQPVVNEGLCVWGTEWDVRDPTGRWLEIVRSTDGVFGKSLVRCYQQCAMFINIQREHMQAPDPEGWLRGSGLGLRHFDVPACESLMLSEWVEELPEAFAIGEEVDVFHTPEELREKIRYWRTHDIQRHAVVQRARARVVADHTYLHRARRLCTLLDTYAT